MKDNGFKILILIVIILMNIFVVGESKTIDENFEKIEQKVDTIEKEVDIAEKKIKEKENTNKLIGTFYVTAYCSCEECCGEWASKRPKDENGNDIVLGSSGRRLISNYSVAVDPSIIPLGSIIYIGGKEYRADDVGGAIQGNRIDVYIDNHDSALEFGIGNYVVETKGE